MAMSKLAEQLQEANGELGTFIRHLENAAKVVAGSIGSGRLAGVGGYGGGTTMEEAGGNGTTMAEAGASDRGRKLVAAAVFFGISPPGEVLLWSVSAQDELLANFDKATNGAWSRQTVGSSGSGGGTSSGDPNAGIQWASGPGGLMLGSGGGDWDNRLLAKSSDLVSEVQGLRRDLRDNGISIRTGGA